MSSNNPHYAGAPGAPMGCLSEHLNYFNDNIAAAQPILEGDFDSIFNKDFDLVFDPILLMNSDAATVARPVNPQPHPHQQPQMYAAPAQQHPGQLYHKQAVPIGVPSSAGTTGSGQYAAPAPSAKPTIVSRSSITHHQHHHHAAAPPATPATAPKLVVKAPIRKTASPQVSPTSVTAVFESIPAPPTPAVAAKAPAPVAKSSPRKRSYSMVQSSPKPAPVTSSPPPPPTDTSNLSFQEQEDLRRERNRHHAKRSRQRKRDYMNSLEEAVNEMRKENERLFDLLGMDSRQAKVDMAKEEERKREVATEKFIAGLKQPRNRVLDNTTLAFLRELWK